jgi:hypothetical protein
MFGVDFASAIPPLQKYLVIKTKNPCNTMSVLQGRLFQVAVPPCFRWLFGPTASFLGMQLLLAKGDHRCKYFFATEVTEDNEIALLYSKFSCSLWLILRRVG